MLKARASSPRKANTVTEKSNLGGRGRSSGPFGLPGPASVPQRPSPVLSASFQGAHRWTPATATGSGFLPPWGF